MLHGGNKGHCLLAPLALVPLKCSSRNVQFPHRVPLKDNMPWCPWHFKNEAYRPASSRKCDCWVLVLAIYNFFIDQVPFTKKKIPWCPCRPALSRKCDFWVLVLASYNFFIGRVPFTKKKIPWWPCPFKNEAYSPVASMFGSMKVHTLLLYCPNTFLIRRSIKFPIRIFRLFH